MASGLQRVSRRIGIDPRAVLGLVVLVGGFLVWALTFTNTIPKLFQSSSKTVHADFASVEAIVPNDPVRINGVQVGTVGSVSVDPGARGSTLTLNLDSSAGNIYNDASASVRWRTALGANDSVTLDPGTPAAGSLGSRTIPQSQTSNQVELDQITQTLHDGARTGAQTMLKQLGPAFSNQLAPAATFSALAQVAPSVAAGVGAVRGVRPDADLRNLVVKAGRAAQALDVGQSASDTQQFVQSAAATLAITGANAANIRAILANANVAMPHIVKTAAGVDHALYLLDPLVAKLNPVAPSVAPTLAQLHPTVVDLNTLLNDATPLLHTLRPTVHSLADTATIGVPVIDQLSPALQQVDTQILPALDKVSPESKHTVYQMIGPTLAGTDGLAAGFDGNGNFARLVGSASENVVDSGLVPCRLNFAPGAQLLTCQTVMQILGQFFTPPTSGSAKHLNIPALTALKSQYPAIAAHILKGIPALGGSK